MVVRWGEGDLAAWLVVIGVPGSRLVGITRGETRGKPFTLGNPPGFHPPELRIRQGGFSAMPVPIPGSKVGSDNQKVKFLTIFGRPKTCFC